MKYGIELGLKYVECPICRVVYTTDIESNDKLNICRACRLEINLCNKKNKCNCYECINEYVYINLDDIGIKKVKIRKVYGCHQGSRLVRIGKKLKIGKIDMLKFLRWNVEIGIIVK